MRSKLAHRAALLAFAFITIAAHAAIAAPEDYEFTVLENEIEIGDGAVISVRLVDKRTGGPVDNAVIFATRMDMAPDGMEMMTTTVESMHSDQPGVYRFKTNLTMAGGWQFSIAAKVQGETETVESRLVFQAVQ